jgi:hypothetical protein
MLSAAHTNLARAAGAAVGIAVAVALLVASQPSATIRALPASVDFTLSPPGTLAANPAPPAPLLRATRLEPGTRRTTASFRLQNQSGTTLRVGVRAKPDARSLDGIVRVRIGSGRRLLADTTLQGLRQGTPATVLMRSGASRHFDLEAWIPATVTDGYQGRIVQVALVVTAPRAGGGS